MRLHDPLWLLALVPLALLAWWRARRRMSVLYSTTALLDGVPRSLFERVHRVLPWLEGLGLVLVVLALARPQRGLEEYRIRTEGVAIVICLDRSGSMEALDFTENGQRVDRLHVVKRVVRDFVGARPDDPLGLVVFGGFAESRCPLTLDHDALRTILADVRIPEPLLDERGRPVDQQAWQEELATAIGDALALGTARLRDAKARSRVIVLVSDGESNAGVIQPLEAARAAAELGIRIHTIGVGTTGVVPIPARDPYGREVVRTRQVRLDEQTLKQIADATGGRYFNAQTTDALERVYARIDELEKTETEGVLYTRYRELFAGLLVPGLAFLLGVLVLRAGRVSALP